MGESGEVRPGHTDLVKHHKSRGFVDVRGGGRSSYRSTITDVIGGSIARTYLQEQFGTAIFSSISQVGPLKATKSLSDHFLSLKETSGSLNVDRAEIERVGRTLRDAEIHSLDADFATAAGELIKQTRIAGREVVRGDVLILNEGDRVPADAVLLSSVNLSVNESLLTGESVPVRKVSADGPLDMGRPGGDDLPFVYSSTLVVQGQGIAQVQATGLQTEIGKIGKALQTVEQEDTLLQRETGRLVRMLAIVGLSLCVLVVIVLGLTRGNWLNGFLAGITLAMAILPEELPVVLTIFLALGAWRMSQRQVLTRRVPAIETLGSTTVLCVDKTDDLHRTAKFFRVNRPTAVALKRVVVHKEGGVLFIRRHWIARNTSESCHREASLTGLELGSMGETDTANE